MHYTTPHPHTLTRTSHHRQWPQQGVTSRRDEGVDVGVGLDMGVGLDVGLDMGVDVGVGVDVDVGVGVGR